VAQALGIELRLFEVRAPTDFAAAVAAATKERVGGLLFAGSPMFVRNRTQIAALLTEHRLPAISVWDSFTEAGVLMAYGPSLPDLFHRAAGYVDKILRGANPGDIPVERPTKFTLVINLKTAKALGLTIRNQCCCGRTRSSRVQRKAGATSGCQSRRGKSQTPRSLDSRVEGNRDSEAYRQSHRTDGERVTGP
jgi:ABC-type uncharacterized transport system substrate-binding protein